MKAFLVLTVALQFFNLALTPHLKNPSAWLGKDIFSSILVLVCLVIGLIMLAPDKGQAEVVKVESGSAPCG